MLKFYDIQQNTDDWLQMRAGRLTSSNLGKVMANYGKAFGEPAKKLAVQIAIERITGQPIANNYSNDHMERGHEQEPVARMLYEEQTFCDVTNGGFYCDDNIGCSPDGVVGVGAIEIKSVIESVQFSNVRRQAVDPAYKWQCVGNLKFTGSEWLDFISYCEGFPEGKRIFIHRIEPSGVSDEFKMIDARISEFMALVDQSIKIVNNSRYCNY
jgi:hypothetical protein